MNVEQTLDAAIFTTVHRFHAKGQTVRIADLLTLLAPPTGSTALEEAKQSEAKTAVINAIFRCRNQGLTDMLSEEEREGWARELRVLGEAYMRQAEALERKIQERPKKPTVH